MWAMEITVQRQKRFFGLWSTPELHARAYD
jgi:hypothetical protein